ncbi:MAG TPA: Wadjet anti-phage system protein JetD domain-containing protein [Ornithinibacter sp.]|nr:Wadjet anti-phage system protein JetD domain-containing protein [Ornithinibacter sp.]
MTGWTTPADIRARAQKRWDAGELLSAYATGSAPPALDLPVRGPTPREVSAQLAQVRSWRDALVAGSRDGTCYTLTERSIGGRVIGAVTLPDRVSITAYDQWWRLLGVAEQVRVLDVVLARTRRTHPALLDWVERFPRRALAVADDWERLLAADDWLVEVSGQGRYLREVTAAGVDTKFIEGHTRVLGEWLDAVVEFDERYPASRRFARRYGFSEAPPLLRLRIDEGLGVLPSGISEVGLRVAEAEALRMAPSHVLIVENLATYLAVPVPAGGAVIWGQGFDAGRLGRVAWLGAAPRVRYWGDLDTHGFAILNLVRSQVPQVTSVLMDRETLLRHRSRWVVEPRATRADLTLLTGAERAVYEDLVEGAHGPAVRLEQERIEWPWVLERL